MTNSIKNNENDDRKYILLQIYKDIKRIYGKLYISTIPKLETSTLKQTLIKYAIHFSCNNMLWEHVQI